MRTLTPLDNSELLVEYSAHLIELNQTMCHIDNTYLAQYREYGDLLAAELIKRGLCEAAVVESLK